MTKTEREDLASLAKRIPCELTLITYDAARDGAAWLGCRECSRCVLIQYLEADFEQVRNGIREMLLNRPENGGYELRKDLRKQ